MLTKSHPAPMYQGQAAGDCPCGCAPCDKQCCDLECLVRPRFFCGQLLTDADLTALVEWSRARFRLARHRHGWGVVCGLEVSRDLQKPAGVLIHPGYAIDCCGNDIVVCDEGWADLAQVCPKAECFDPYVARKKRVRDLEDEQASDRRAEGGLLSRLLADTQAVDLFLHYYEVGAEPQTALRSGACGTSECIDSRAREGYRLSWQVVGDRDAPDRAWQAWKDAYGERRTAARELVRQLNGNDDVRAVRDAVLRWIGERTPGQFYFAYDWVQRLDRKPSNESDDDYQKRWRSELPEVVFWLYLDGLIAWLACNCANCDPSEGIPLARVWLRGAESGQPCRVMAIDNASPYRRHLPRHDDCLPAPPGCANMGDLIGRRWEDARGQLDARGINPGEPEVITTLNWEGLAAILACEPAAACDRTVHVQLVELGGWGKRVIGFCKGYSL